MGQRSIGFGRVAGIAGNPEHLVIDKDQLGGVFGDIAGIRNDHGDRLSDVTRFMICQRGKRQGLLDQRIRHQQGKGFVAQIRREIIEREDRMHPWQRACGGYVYL